jgi:membrane protein
MAAFFNLLKTTFREWSEDQGPRLGAAIAYYSVFSIAPLLVVTVSIVGMIFGADAAEGKVAAQLTQMVGREAAEFVEELIKGSSKPAANAIATTAGLAVSLIGASGVFVELQHALNTIWKLPQGKRGLAQSIRNRVLCFAVVLGTGVLLVALLIAGAAATAMSGRLKDSPIGNPWLLQLVHLTVSLAGTAVMFALVFKVLPDTKPPWREAWIGGVVTSILFTLGKLLIGIYLTKTSIASVYGAAGSLVLLLVWVYYSSQIVLLGAEFTSVYSRKRQETGEPFRAAEVDAV